MAKMVRTEKADDISPLPEHLQLAFTVYKNGLISGEIHQQLDIQDGRYVLRSVSRASGLTSLRNSDQLVETSLGKFDGHGFQPDIFEADTLGKHGKQIKQVTFDREQNKLRYPDGSESALPDGVQDKLSFLYQLSQIRMDDKEYFALPVTDDTGIRQYQIEIGAKADVKTPIGMLHTQSLREIHDQNSSHFEIWLGLEYRLLPVMIKQFDGAGNVLEETAITDIRAKDE